MDHLTNVPEMKFRIDQVGNKGFGTFRYQLSRATFGGGWSFVGVFFTKRGARRAARKYAERQRLEEVEVFTV